MEEHTITKEQIVERLKSATNILVTVSKNPSVDQLAAIIGVTLLLNKLGKHATAVFSGSVPSTLEFLKPDETIEKTTQSLQDFIIALDKSKADKLRYKVEDNYVKIFITPYRASLSEKDLEFSQGDFNIDVVLALGVHQQNDLDDAITSHGRILHDAEIITVNTSPDGDFGSMHWNDSHSSSLSEMLAELADVFDPKALDPQMATAFLTGIVAETQRFSNPKTTPRTMTFASRLMAAGANQQLIASKLDVRAADESVAGTHEPPRKSDSQLHPADNGESQRTGDSSQVNQAGQPKAQAAASPKTAPASTPPNQQTVAAPEQKVDGQITIDHHGNISPLSGSSDSADTAVTTSGPSGSVMPSLEEIISKTSSNDGINNKPAATEVPLPPAPELSAIPKHDGYIEPPGNGARLDQAAKPLAPDSPSMPQAAAPPVSPSDNPLFSTPPSASLPPASEPPEQAGFSEPAPLGSIDVNSNNFNEQAPPEPTPSAPDSSLDAAQQAVAEAIAGSPEQKTGIPENSFGSANPPDGIDELPVLPQLHPDLPPAPDHVGSTGHVIQPLAPAGDDAPNTPPPPGPPPMMPPAPFGDQDNNAS